MPTYRRSQHIGVPARRVFDLVSDVSRLPRYFTRLTEATPRGGDRVETKAVVDAHDGQDEHIVTGEAWLRTDPSTLEVTWGAPGPNDYQGSIQIESDGDDASTVVLEILTESPHDGIDGEIDATLERLVTAVSADS